MLAFLYYLNFQKMLDREHSGTSVFIQGNMINVNLHLKQIKLLPVSNSDLFPVQVVQKCQLCQLCVLREPTDGLYPWLSVLGG